MWTVLFQSTQISQQMSQQISQQMESKYNIKYDMNGQQRRPSGMQGFDPMQPRQNASSGNSLNRKSTFFIWKLIVLSPWRIPRRLPRNISGDAIDDFLHDAHLASSSLPRALRQW